MHRVEHPTIPRTYNLLSYEKSRAQQTTGATTVHRYNTSQNHFDPIFTHMLTHPLSIRHMSEGFVLSSQFVNSMAMYIDARAKIRWNMSGRYGSSCLSSSPVPKMWEVPNVSVLYATALMARKKPTICG
jgi:hypothetical protein